MDGPINDEQITSIASQFTKHTARQFAFEVLQLKLGTINDLDPAYDIVLHQHVTCGLEIWRRRETNRKVESLISIINKACDNADLGIEFRKVFDKIRESGWCC